MTFDPEAGVTVFEPERAEPGYWVGCPGVLRDEGRHLMTYRRRRPRGAAGTERGWRCAVAVSADGLEFEDVWAVEKGELATPSMERFSLYRRRDGVYQLYLSYVDPADGRWRIDVAEAAAPDGFDVAARRPVFTAATTGTQGVKDPRVVRTADGRVVMLVSAARAALSERDLERAHATADIHNTGLSDSVSALAESADDGRTWEWRGIVFEPGAGWDRWAARLNSVVETGGGYLGFYDGEVDHTRNYEEKTGLAWSADLADWKRLTPDGPAVVSASGTGSVRYVDAVPQGDGRLRLYYEMTRADGAHDLRTLELLSAEVSRWVR
ncbi:hypothetical protein [Actinomadura citrea]|uniref:Uncharacterized protein n=1 Tax=Actinomadura citrea TaxID=46158 RepID=A0A7Y9KHQ6_9ACTN|nr:hypothetical protein [Actinomadura citrea]NYE16283.1 hypothetical protein [Actinomadura citrea]GGT96074.1 hypothetical protein GCM10010177_64110 [Actinomadura citrea]